ncbi:MAG: glycosyltransferase [Polyangiales bacterium]
MSRFIFLIPDERRLPRGGIMNIVRHCAVARELGAETALATYTGGDAHGKRWFRHDEKVIKWSDRRPDDICLIADFYSAQVEDHPGPCIVYEQVPVRIQNDFDYMRDNVQIWTDSPFMLELCQAAYPGKDIPIVPNVVDDKAFPFTPQEQKQRGLMIVFPRKGKDFIKAVFKLYKKKGGRYWKPKALNKMRLDKMAEVFCQAEAFLASAEMEGCALPPQEAMSAGVVVVGKTAKGANFSMRHGETALISESVEDTVDSFFQLEDTELRSRLSKAGHEFISRYHPANEPSDFWRRVLDGDLSFK